MTLPAAQFNCADTAQAEKAHAGKAGPRLDQAGQSPVDHCSPLAHAGQTAPMVLFVGHGACHEYLEVWTHHKMTRQLWRPDCPTRAVQSIANNCSLEPEKAALEA